MSKYGQVGTTVLNKLPTNNTNLITATDVRSVFSELLGATIQLENIMNYGAIGDGVSHGLSQRYANLAAAQVDYPFATSLSQEIDACAIEKAIRTGNGVYIPDGTFIVDNIVLNGMNVYLDSAPNGTLKSFTTNKPMFTLTSSTVKIKNIKADGNSQASGFLFQTQGTLEIDNLELSNFGHPSVANTTYTAGLSLDTVTSIKIKRIVCNTLKAVGNSIADDAIGAARGIYLTTCGYFNIGYFECVAGDAEELDYLFVGPSCDGGTVDTFVGRYNGNTSRCVKTQSGKVTLKNVDIRKNSDFATDSGTTDVGTKNISAFDVYTTETENYKVTLDLISGYIDASGFQYGISCSAGAGVIKLHPGITLKGGTKNVIRTHPLLGAQSTPSVGFYTQSTSVGSGINGATIINFGIGAKLASNFSFSMNANFIDQKIIVAEIGDSGNAVTSNIKFLTNTMSTKTTGYLNDGTYGDIIHVYNAQTVNINDNIFVEDGNTSHNSTLIKFSNASATGIVKGNNFPTTMTGVNLGSTTQVKSILSNAILTSSFLVAVSDEISPLAVATGVITFRFPYTAKLTEVRASVNTASVGANIIVNVKKNGTSIFSTLLSIDATEKTSVTAATPAVLSTTNIASDDEISVDITQVGSTTEGVGLKLTFLYTN